MKITRRQLKRIITEARRLTEYGDDYDNYDPMQDYTSYDAATDDLLQDYKDWARQNGHPFDSESVLQLYARANGWSQDDQEVIELERTLGL